MFYSYTQKFYQGVDVFHSSCKGEISNDLRYDRCL